MPVRLRHRSAGRSGHFPAPGLPGDAHTAFRRRARLGYNAGAMQLGPIDYYGPLDLDGPPRERRYTALLPDILDTTAPQ